MRARTVSLLLAAIVAVAACTGDTTTEQARADEGLRVASFNFDESQVLAEAYAQVIESIGVPVLRLGAVGPREIIAPALELDRIDLVPEYLGTALSSRGAVVPADPDTALLELDQRLHAIGLRALTPAPAQDRNVFVVTAETAERERLVTVSDLVPIAASLRFGGLPECVERPLCLVGLRDVYGVEFASFVPQPSLTFTAEALRRGEIDVGLLFSTAPELADPALVALVDDRALQPPENVVPVIRQDAIERWGSAVPEMLNALSAELTTSELRRLNLRVARGDPIERVAAEWLAAQTLLPTP